MTSQASFPPGYAFIEGTFKPIADAKLSILDWGFLRSDATYDVVHVWQGRFFRLDRHIERFLNSAERLRLSIPYRPHEIAAILAECVVRAGLEAAYVEMICTRGRSASGSRDPRTGVNQFIAFAIPFSWILPPERWNDGLHLGVSSIPRIAPESVDPRIKNYHWLDMIAALFEAYDQACETAVLIDSEGQIVEGPGFNIFALCNGHLKTPSRGVLEGITRQTVLELCAELSQPVSITTLKIDELRRADEVFVTSTAGGIMPVSKLDHRLVGSGTPGPLTHRLKELYWQKHEAPEWSVALEGALSGKLTEANDQATRFDTDNG